MSACSRRLDQPRDQLRLVLAVAVDRHQHVVAAPDREVEGRHQGRPVAQVPRVVDQMDVVPPGQQFRSAVGRAVVDHQHLLAVGQRTVDHRPDVGRLIEHRQGCQDAVCHAPILSPAGGEANGEGEECRRLQIGDCKLQIGATVRSPPSVVLNLQFAICNAQFATRPPYLPAIRWETLYWPAVQSRSWHCRTAFQSVAER